MTQQQAEDINGVTATAKTPEENLIPQEPFTEKELTDTFGSTIEIARENGYVKAIHDCFNLVMDENMPEPLKLRLMSKIHDLSKKLETV